jgi:ribosomal protein S18 acetylase RimI-like enzyme
MNPVARPARANDVALLVDLLDEFYAESDYALDREEAADSFRQLFRDPSRGAVWVLEVEGSVGGYVVLSVGFSMEYGGLDGFVDDLFVRPEFRQQGLGRTALETLLAECRHRGIRAVHLEVGRDNYAAKRLYAGYGFRDNDRQLLTLRLPQDEVPS